MKFHYAFNVGLGMVLLLPAWTLGGQSTGSLEQDLVRTMQAIEALGGLERRLADGDAAGVEEALLWTEQPAGEASTQEESLLELRREVHELQTLADALDPDWTPRGPVETEPVPRPKGAEAVTVPRPQVAPTTGLDAETRARLEATSVVVGAPQGRSARARAPQAFEDEGFVADPLRLARIRYRQERYQEALDALAGHEADPEVRYLTARCLRALGRDHEALANYRALAEQENAGVRAEDARYEAEFLEWKIAFEQREKKD
jgi:hypothetical protein